MQRPQNRQGQSNRGEGQTRRRGRGGRATSYPQAAVPNITQVIPNASVSIVLKIDQPTGRQVQGTVADVLTSGNHPRGIKVRLVDGRVGRVQRMVSAEEARVGSEGLTGLGEDGEIDENGRVDGRDRRGRGRGRGEGSRGWGSRRYGDVREDDYLEGPREGGYSLGDFLPADHPLMVQEGSPVGNDERSGFERPTEQISHTCPVCGEFEGDEIAVSRHVGEHFD